MTTTSTTSEEPWVVEGEGFSSRIGGKLLVHCFVVMFLGFIGGFVWLIALADNVLHLFPIPSLDIEVPDTPEQKELLRNAHTGPIMNSTYVMVMVLLSKRLNFSMRQAKWFFYAAIVTLWGNTIGYSFAVYAPERGLQPVGDWQNLISYFTFYAAVVGAVITTGLCLKQAIGLAKAPA